MEQLIHSEWQLVIHLITYGTAKLTPYEIYKACVPDALNGKIRSESLGLPSEYQDLLEARKAMYESSYLSSFKKLRHLIRNSNDFLIKGDCYYIYGLIFHRLGRIKWAESFLNQAEIFYSQTADQHKYLRCLINKHICKDSIESYFKGDLFFLKQRCMVDNYLDLIGNIEKSLSCELISIGNFDAGLVAAEAAQIHYGQAGCAEDANVAQVLIAICLYCQGEKHEATKVRSLLQSSKGKFKSFLKIYDQLAQGQKPTINEDHPLYKTPWPVHQFRKNSVVGQVYLRLSLGPVSREELISTVWGPKAIDPSYVTRLHTVITSLRGKYHFAIEYDGEFYSLISTNNTQKQDWKMSV